jgi:sulfane dehydrogenase subunit SoxC
MADQTEDKKKISRRRLLAGAATAVSITLLEKVGGQTVHAQTGKPAPPSQAKASTSSPGAPPSPVQPEDPTKRPGPGPGTVGKRSPFEHPAKKPTEFASRSPLQDQIGTLTPSDLHFERHHAGVPVIDPAKYKLLIHGMVEKPMIFDLE